MDSLQILKEILSARLPNSKKRQYIPILLFIFVIQSLGGTLNVDVKYFIVSDVQMVCMIYPEKEIKMWTVSKLLKV